MHKIVCPQRFLAWIGFWTAAAGVLAGCNTPLQSQKFFSNSVKNDPLMEQLHQTALYTVYFDHALQRCILHSTYTWGESGGGTGGTGLGVSVFSCNPRALKEHIDSLQEQIDNGTEYFDLPDTRGSQPKAGIVRKPVKPARPPATPSLRAPEGTGRIPAAQPAQSQSVPPTPSQPVAAGSAPQTTKPLETSKEVSSPTAPAGESETRPAPKLLQPVAVP